MFHATPKLGRQRLDTIWKVRKEAGIDAMNFFADIPLNYAMDGREDTVDYSNPNSGSALVFDGQSPLRQLFKIDGANRALADKAQARARDKTFERRCQDGDLPPVSFIEPPYLGRSTCSRRCCGARGRRAEGLRRHVPSPSRPWQKRRTPRRS